MYIHFLFDLLYTIYCIKCTERKGQENRNKEKRYRVDLLLYNEGNY